MKKNMVSYYDFKWILRLFLKKEIRFILEFSTYMIQRKIIQLSDIGNAFSVQFFSNQSLSAFNDMNLISLKNLIPSFSFTTKSLQVDVCVVCTYDQLKKTTCSIIINYRLYLTAGLVIVWLKKLLTEFIFFGWNKVNKKWVHVISFLLSPWYYNFGSFCWFFQSHVLWKIGWGKF